MKKKKQLEAQVTPAAKIAVPATTGRSQVRRATGKCTVCGEEVAPFSSEQLCWVCRRLKISAWRDSENQAAIQE